MTPRLARRLLALSLPLACASTPNALAAVAAKPSAAASLGPPEELLDADGFLGMALDAPWEEAKVLTRLGKPGWVDEEGGEDTQLPTKRLLWEAPGPEPEDGETGCRSLRIDLAADEQGRWWLRDLEVGSRFRFPPRILGRPLEAGASLEQALTGAIQEGRLLSDHLRGLQLWRWPEASGVPGFRTATLLAPALEPRLAPTRELEALWRAERVRQGQAWLNWWPWARPALGLRGVIVPARVVEKRREGERWRVRLALPEGLRPWGEEPESRWGDDLGLRLQEGPSGEAVKAGDLALLTASPVVWGPEGSLKLGLWRWLALKPQGPHAKLACLWGGPRP